MNDQIVQPVFIREPDAVGVGRGKKKYVSPPHTVASVPDLIGSPPLDNAGHFQIGMPMDFPAKRRAQRHTADFNQPPAVFIQNFHICLCAIACEDFLSAAIRAGPRAVAAMLCGAWYSVGIVCAASHYNILHSKAPHK